MAKKAITNPDDIMYKMAPFYNLGAIRRDLNTLVVRSAHDAEMLAAITETCEAAIALGRARHKAEAEHRAEIARQIEAAAAKAAAEKAAMEKAAAEADIVTAEGMIARATAFLKGE